ncbi:MAG: hypothetical protein M0R70_12955 [Nitrospirae bacterium]|nr:hypothetical protein [Nitrospirota bacterium]
MKKILLVLLVLFVGCAGGLHRDEYSRLHNDAKEISNGIIKLQFDLRDFVDVWGYPETMRSITATSDEKTFSAVWNAFGGSAYQGKRTSVLQVWDYKKNGITLFFDDDGRLVSWKTDKTVEELKAIYHNKYNNH